MTKKKGPCNLENNILPEELQERKFPETSPSPRRGNQESKDCEEMWGVSGGHPFKVFEVSSKGRVEAFKKVESEEMRDVALSYCLF